MKIHTVLYNLGLFTLLMVAALIAQPRGAVTLERLTQERYRYDSLAVRSLNPTYDIFPEASLVDFSFLLDPPGGKHGFVRPGSDGHLEFEDSTRARFWGVVIDQQNVNIPKHLIDLIVETLARSGANLIRLHSIDNRTGEKYGIVRQNIIDQAHPNTSTSQFLDEDIRDRVDYWIAAAKKRGIYTYLGFRAYRSFRQGDGVPNADSLDRAARPYAIFNRRLIDLQKDYIDSLAVFHVNPYTGLAYARDPAIICYELVNEDDLLFRPEVWSKMPQPYWKEFNELWNQWLLERYGTTAKLKLAWMSTAGTTALAAGESLEKKNIRLPNMELSSFDQAVFVPHHDPLRSPARRTDAVRFAMEVQKRYFQELKEHCITRGIRVPLNAVVRTDLRPMTYSVSQHLDMTASNAYVDHPSFLPGKEWLSQEFFTNKNYLTESGSGSFAAVIAQYHWFGKPAAIREWSTCWPNQYRGASMLETAAYASFQGFDIVTHFNYTTTGHFTGLSSFGLQADPVRWGLFGLAAKLFLSGDVAEAQRTIGILFAEDDLANYAEYQSNYYRMAWLHKVINAPVDTALQYPFDFTVTAGRSHLAPFTGKNGLLYALTPYVNTQLRQVANEQNSLYAGSGYPLPIMVMRSDTVVAFSGSVQQGTPIRWGFKTEDIREQGLIPIGSDRSNHYAAGFRDTIRNIIGLGGIPEPVVILQLVRLMNETYKTPTLPEMFEHNIFVSDTRELSRDATEGTMTINTPFFAAVQGALSVGKRYDAGPLSVSSQSSIGVIAVTALNHKPLSESSLLLLKMVTVAENYGQDLDTVDIPALGRKMLLRSRGQFPVVTNGKVSLQPTTLWMNGKKILEVYLKDGTWELLLDLNSGKGSLYCDTPNIRFALFPEEPPRPLMLRRYLYGREPLTPTPVSTDFIYPGYSKYITIESPAI